MFFFFVDCRIRISGTTIEYSLLGSICTVTWLCVLDCGQHGIQLYVLTVHAIGTSLVIFGATRNILRTLILVCSLCLAGFDYGFRTFIYSFLRNLLDPFLRLCFPLQLLRNVQYLALFVVCCAPTISRNRLRRRIHNALTIRRVTRRIRQVLNRYVHRKCTWLIIIGVGTLKYFLLQFIGQFHVDFDCFRYVLQLLW